MGVTLALKKVSKKKVVYTVVLAFFLYWLLFRQKRVLEKFEFVVEDVEPKALWEYWADFSNYKQINPTILDFTVDYEHGTYDHWEYGVTYTESLVTLPILTVKIKGRLIVTPEQKKGHFSEPYRIISEHDTCLWSFFCTHADSDMTFTKTPTQGGRRTDLTTVTETVAFDTSALSHWYSLRELRGQRALIKERLEQIDFHSIGF